MNSITYGGSLMSESSLRLIAYELVDGVEEALVRAPARRAWMDETASQFAYRCLPLVIANQSGWLLKSAVSFTAIWTGGKTLPDVRVAFYPEQVGYGGWKPEQCVVSHFGEGILTFVVPYLFRTPAGYNMWVKGPANCFKDGIQALEGIIETDWSHATFTMNWKFTRANQAIRFEAGEPICQLVPAPRGLLEQFQPELRSLNNDADVAADFARWREARRAFMDDLKVQGSDAQRRGWEKGYVKGKMADGSQFDRHQTSLKLREFERGRTSE
jgi:hypothetical protein